MGKDCRGFQRIGLPLLFLSISIMILAGCQDKPQRFDDITMEDAQFQDAVLSHASFLRATLPGADFSSAKLEKSTFVHASLPQAKFANADLSWAQLAGANAEHTSFAKASLKNANLEFGQFAQCNFSDATLDGAFGDHADFRRSSFRGASLKDFKATRTAIFAGADFSSAQLQHAHLSTSMLMFAVLADANLDGADLSDANLAGADLLGLKGWETATWNGANIIGVQNAPAGFTEFVLGHGGNAHETEFWPIPAQFAPTATGDTVLSTQDSQRDAEFARIAWRQKVCEALQSNCSQWEWERYVSEMYPDKANPVHQAKAQSFCIVDILSQEFEYVEAGSRSEKATAYLGSEWPNLVEVLVSTAVGQHVTFLKGTAPEGLTVKRLPASRFVEGRDLAVYSRDLCTEYRAYLSDAATLQ